MVSLFRFPSKALQAKSESIGRASNLLASAIQDVGIAHRRFHITMAQQLLHRLGRKARNAESRVQIENLKRTMTEGRDTEMGEECKGGEFSP